MQGANSPSLSSSMSLMLHFEDHNMPDQLLFICHSLVGYKMPKMFNSFMNSPNLDVHVDKQVING